jgi:hypothetical protein
MKTVVMILALSIPTYAGCDTFANGNFIRCDDGPTVFKRPDGSTLEVSKSMPIPRVRTFRH